MNEAWVKTIIKKQEDRVSLLPSRHRDVLTCSLSEADTSAKADVYQPEADYENTTGVSLRGQYSH